MYPQNIYELILTRQYTLGRNQECQSAICAYAVIIRLEDAMNFNIHFSCVSHIGNSRRMNQDNFICNGQYLGSQSDELSFPIIGCVPTNDKSVFGIFDGMGGEECGEIASLIAAQNASSLAITRDAIADLLKYCADANESICKYASDNAVSSMGTTAALLAFTDKGIALCNIGDSKIFRFANGKMKQISVDHVAVTAHDKKPPLSQNLGIDPTEMIISPYVAKGHYNVDDIYLICSDGLTDMVSENDITEILRKTSYDDVVNKLLDAALDNGGLDNITVILCKVEQEKRSLLSRLFTKNKGIKVRNNDK